MLQQILFCISSSFSTRGGQYHFTFCCVKIVLQFTGDHDGYFLLGLFLQNEIEHWVLSVDILGLSAAYVTSCMCACVPLPFNLM